jgi:hypothetical protein
VSDILYRRVNGRIVPIQLTDKQLAARDQASSKGAKIGAVAGAVVGVAVAAKSLARSPTMSGSFKTFTGGIQNAAKILGRGLLRPTHLSIVGAPAASFSARLGIRAKMAGKAISAGSSPLIGSASLVAGMASIYGAAVGGAFGAGIGQNYFESKLRNKNSASAKPTSVDSASRSFQKVRQPDELDLVEYAMHLEDKTGRKIADKHMEKAKTYKQATELFKKYSVKSK